MSRHRFIPRPTLDEELRTRALRYPSALERPARRGLLRVAVLAAVALAGAIAAFWRWS